jgi:glycosyltransferase involved in cell wall biosynthesis
MEPDLQGRSRPRLLVSAYSFAPRQGSESGTGWQTVATLSEDYDVTVVCADHYRVFFEPADINSLAERGVEVEFFAASHGWIRQLPGGTIWPKIYYWWWQKNVRGVFQRLIAEKQPVAVQHVTWGTGRVRSGLSGLGVPVIIGPVGGFEPGDLRLARQLGPKVRLGELLRRLHLGRSMRSRELQTMYANADLVLACTAESEQAVRRLGAGRIERMTNAGIATAQLERLSQMRNAPPLGKGLRVFFASRLVGWKGEEIALRAVAKTNDSAVRLTVLGSGPNQARCRKLARQLGVADRVEFIDFLPNWEDVWGLYATSDVLLFPSLHDSGGTGVIEAMAAGLPVICLDLGGPAECVDASCGFKVPPGPLEQVTSEIARRLTELRDHPERREAMGIAAIRRCRDFLTWEARGKRLRASVRSVWDKALLEPSVLPRS